MDTLAPDFETLFQHAPAAMLVLAADAPAFTIVAATDAYFAATMTRREDLLGRPLFEAFPDNPADPTATGTKNLGASLGRVLRNRAADAMPIQRYDIRRRLSPVVDFEERHWAPHNAPVVRGGSIVNLLHRVEDVTDLRTGAMRMRVSLRGEASGVIRIASGIDVSLLREAVRDACEREGMKPWATSDLVVAASELGRNVLVHAGGGFAEVERIATRTRRGMRLRFSDDGPGITNVEAALAGGNSTAGGLGLGLAGARKLVDDFDLTTGPRGTTIVVTKWI